MLCCSPGRARERGADAERRSGERGFDHAISQDTAGRGRGAKHAGAQVQGGTTRRAREPPGPLPVRPRAQPVFGFYADITPHRSPYLRHRATLAPRRERHATQLRHQVGEAARHNRQPAGPVTAGVGWVRPCAVPTPIVFDLGPKYKTWPLEVGARSSASEEVPSLWLPCRRGC